MKTIVGKVVSTKMQSTVVVERELLSKHPLYQKIIRKNRRIKAGSDMTVNVGDEVELVSTRPLAKEKHYKILKVLRKHDTT